MLKEQALAILHEWVQSESLRRHCYAVADSMKHFAQASGADADLWEAVGLLHDMDYERHPNQEQSAIEGHPFVGVAWLRENGWSEQVCRAVLSHADKPATYGKPRLSRPWLAFADWAALSRTGGGVGPSESVPRGRWASGEKKFKRKG